MTEKLALKTISRILEIEKRENDFSCADGFLFQKDTRLCRVSDIANISYRKETEGGFSVYICCDDFKAVVIFDDNGADAHIEPTGSRNLYGDDMAKYLERYFITHEAKNALDNGKLLATLEKLIEENSDNGRAKIAYIDAFLSERDGFSEEKATEYIRENLQKYIK